MRGEQYYIRKKFLAVSDEPAAWADGDDERDVIKIFKDMFKPSSIDPNDIKFRIYNLTDYSECFFDSDSRKVYGSIVDGYEEITHYKEVN